jgi:hypothetical protein
MTEHSQTGAVPTEERIKIVCAALRKHDHIICGVRHFDELMVAQIQRDGRDWRMAEQGFVNNRYQFMTREEAWDLACRNGQYTGCQDRNMGALLYSEDLW